MVRGPHTKVANLAVDLFCVVAALSAGGLWSTGPYSTRTVVLTAIARVLLYSTVWVLVSHRLGTYLVPIRRNTWHATQCGLDTWAITWGIAGLVDLSLLANPEIQIWTTLAAGALFLVLARAALVRTPLAHATGVRPRVLLVGSCQSARTLVADSDAARAMDIVGYVPFQDEGDATPLTLPKAGELRDIQDVIARENVDLALVCPSDQAVTGDVHRVFRLCDEAGLGVQYFPSFLNLEHLHVSLAWNADRPGLAFHSLPNQSLMLLCKRAIDVAGAVAGILLLLPVFVACALAVKLSSRGPILFRQTRVGRNGLYFTCFKFRTMYVGAHELQEKLRSKSVQDGPAFKVPGDPRVTPFGKLLRKFSLDELPQLFNVLLGDMSLVGPRPPIPSEVRNYTWWQRRRISVKPGLTCVWQVWGRNRVSFKRWVEMDLFYIDNWSLWLDVKLILHTFRAVLRGTGM